MKAAEKHDVAEQHQPFDVMAVATAQGMADGVINRRKSRCPGVEGVRDWSVLKLPEIAVAHDHTMPAIHHGHEFPPSDDLTNESLQRIERNVTVRSTLEGAVKNLLWR